MNFRAFGADPQPSLAWTFESSNVDYVTGLTPSSTVQPGPAQLQGAAALVTNAPTSNTAVSFPGTTGAYMNLGTSSPVNVNVLTSNLFVECWVYPLTNSSRQFIIATGSSNQNWVLQTVSGSSTPNIFVNLYPNGSGGGNFGNTAPLNTWTHLAFSWALGPTSNTLSGFVNGIQSFQQTTTFGIYYSSGINTYIAWDGGSLGSNMYIRDLRVVQGGVVPTASFTPAAAPFSYALPSYVTGSGSTVFTLLGQFVTYVPGKFGTSIYFDNKNATSSGLANTSVAYYGSGVTSKGLNSNIMSYSVWIKPYYSFPTSGLAQNFLRLTDSQTAYELSINSGVDTNQIFFYSSAGSGTTIKNGTNLVSQAWNHYSVVLSNVNMTASNTSASFYFNGNQVGATANLVRSATSTLTAIVLAAGGIGDYNGGWCELDDLRVYNTALSAAQVQSNYTQGGAPASSFRYMPQPTLAWSFERTTAPYVGAATATVTGSPTYVAGKFGQAINFTNTAGSAPSQLVSYPVSLSSATGFSVSFWAQFNTYNSGFQTPIALWDGSALMSIFGTTVLYLYWGRSGGAVQASQPFSYTTRVWYHLTITYGSQTVTLYINGVPTIATLYISGTPSGTVISPDATFTTLYVGANSGGNAFNGLIDDLRVYNTALSAAQVRSIYAAQGMPSRVVQNAAVYSNIAAPSIYSFTSQLFSNAQSTSNIGPTQIQLNTIYPTLAPTYLTSNTGIQTWTVPLTGVYSIVAAGAVGGTGSSGGGTAGRGVIVGCQAIFQKNQKVSIIVGQAGVSAALQTTSNIGGGGGGGSFVVDYETGYLYIAAGGGGGCSASPVGGSYSGIPNGYDASYISVGVNGGATSGGSDGQGGVAFTGGSVGNGGGSGAGFYTNGGSGLGGDFNGGQGGFAVLNGSQGGLCSNALNFTNSFGGFGGGAGSGGNFNSNSSGGAGGGGGGGYSGGGAGVRHGSGGGGGGSFVPQGQTMSQLGYCTSNGYISITYLYPVATRMTGTPLFTQLSPSAASSAVGAFSLRAVNGTSARAVQVQARPVVQWPPVAMTSNTSVISGQVYGNGTYVASSSNLSSGTSTQEYKVFDYDVSSFYEQNYILGGAYYQSTGALVIPTQTQTTVSGATAQGEWLQIQLPTTVTLRRYTFVPRTGQEYRCPSTFWIAGSLDGATWSNVHFQSGITGYTNPNGINFNIPLTSNSIAYSYYRMIVNSIQGIGGGGTQILNIASWNIYGDSTSYTTATQDFYADRLGNLFTAPVTGQTLQNWLGGATGYVSTWYDQSGKGNHMAQTTASLQPTISLETSPASIVFTGNGTTSGQYFQNTIPFTFNFGTNYQYGIRAVVNNTVGGCLIYKGIAGFPWDRGGLKKWYMSALNSSTETATGGYPNTVGFNEGYVYGQSAISSSKSSVTWSSSEFSSVALYENASSVSVSYSSRNNQYSDASSYLYMGAGGGSSYYNGSVYEIEIFSSPLSSNDIVIMG